MACNILFIPVAMATTQLARVVHCPAKTTWHMDDNTKRNLRTSWVVTTDSTGGRTLRMQWTSAEGPHD